MQAVLERSSGTHRRSRQVELFNFEKPAERLQERPAEAQSRPQVYDCTTCRLNKGFKPVGEKQKVRCMGRLKEIPKNGCACWSDGKELEEMAKYKPPADFVPKSRRTKI